MLEKSRLILFSLFMIAIAILLGGRLFELQILKGKSYFHLSQNTLLRKTRIEAPRGQILDRHGRVLAENQARFSLNLNLNQVQDLEESLTNVADLLGVELPLLRSRFIRQKKRARDATVVLAESLSWEQVARLRGKLSEWATIPQKKPKNISGIKLEVSFQRLYPYGEVLAHLLGYIRQVNAKDLAAWEAKAPGRVGPRGKIGMKGVEKTWDEKLRGFDGFEMTLTNALGQPVDLSEWNMEPWWKNVLPQRGEDLQLSVDAELSQVAYEALGDHSGAVVALDPQNGEVLVMVSKPAYSPEVFQGRLSPEVWASLRDHPDKILLNRPLQGSYPPGSTHKIVTAVAALAEGKLTLSERISCPGYYQLGKRKWGCWLRSGHGSVNLAEALKHSCDVFFYQVGQRLGPDVLAHYAKLLGLGEKTGILRDSERSGLIPTRAWKEKDQHQPWQAHDDLGNAIGQGYNLVTPLQNALMIARFAGAKAIEPTLLKQDEKQDHFKKLSWKLKPEQYQVVKQALIEVVNGVGGTGKRARVPGVTVAGKTGTAQVVSLEKSQQGGRKNQDHAWFVAFAPAEDPQIALAVLVEHGRSGGGVAAPVAQKVLQAFFAAKKTARRN